jgi:hypothetical protein
MRQNSVYLVGTGPDFDAYECFNHCRYLQPLQIVIIPPVITPFILETGWSVSYLSQLSQGSCIEEGNMGADTSFGLRLTRRTFELVVVAANIDHSAVVRLSGRRGSEADRVNDVCQYRIATADYGERHEYGPAHGRNVQNA